MTWEEVSGRKRRKLRLISPTPGWIIVDKILRKYKVIAYKPKIVFMPLSSGLASGHRPKQNGVIEYSKPDRIFHMLESILMIDPNC
jgi:hypothetical protein